MEWDISFSKQVDKFLRSNHIPDQIVYAVISRAIKKLSGENISVDVKRMEGVWSGYFRARTGKKRIIFSIDFVKHQAHVAVFDYRGNVYK